MATILDRTILVGDSDFKQENTKAMYIQIVISARKEIWNVPRAVGEADLRAISMASEEVTFELDLKDG